jgi:THO complex subunit 7
MAVSEDDIIKRKLLIEGDGGNDDRRINSLLKTFVKWTQSTTESPEESDSTYQKMLAMLTQCEMTMAKSVLVHNMNQREQQNYEHLNTEIEQMIKDATEKIAECKKELNEAKCIRRNRQEYDALAKVIQQHPDRQETLRQIEALDKELEVHRQTEKMLHEKLALRRKQFHVLVTAIHQLQSTLEEDEGKDEAAAQAMDST